MTTKHIFPMILILLDIGAAGIYVAWRLEKIYLLDGRRNADCYRNILEDIMAENLNILPQESIRIECGIAKDGSLNLYVAMFEKNGWLHWHQISFAEISNSCNNLEQLKNILINKKDVKICQQED